MLDHYIFYCFISFQAEKHNRIILAGNCKIVGQGGFLAGGGIGRFSPALGIGVDSVLEIKVTLRIIFK